MQVLKTRLLFALVAMASGRAMTLAFVSRAGDGGAGDPPRVWLMPLIGDAAVGLTALGVAWLIWKRPSPTAWTIAVTWSAIGAFDAIAALLVEITAPWPEFFMLEIFGRTMFFAAAGLHLFIIALLVQHDVLEHFGLRPREQPRQATGATL